jgi:NADH-quinone oxidoreductase subunit E
MLNNEELQAIREEMGRYPVRRAAVPEALRILQRSRGWVTDEAVQDIAGLVGVSPEEVEAVATFYSLIFRRPVGRHVILLCDSVSCWVLGSDRLRDELTSRLGIGLGQTTTDGRFTLLPAACLGACDQGPAMMVDDELHERLTVENLGDILQRYP